MKNITTAMNAQQAMKELNEAEQLAFLASLEGLSPAEKQVKREVRRNSLQERKEKNQAERQAFVQSLEGLAPNEKRAKRQERKANVVEQCNIARLALTQATRASFMATLDGLTDEERETKWLERRAVMQQRMVERKAARRDAETSLKEELDTKKTVATKKLKYDHEELAKFKATLKGLGPRAKQVKWQNRIKALRADIKLNGGGNGNRRALHLARKQRDVMALRAGVKDLALAKDFAGSVSITKKAEASDGTAVASKFKKTNAKYDDEELSVFQASLKNLSLAETKMKWQARAKELRGDIETNGPGGGNRKALRMAREEIDKLAKIEKVSRKTNFAGISDEGGSAVKKIKYNVGEVEDFQASLQGLSFAEKEMKWQARIQELRADIQANGPGGGNRNALRLARQEFDKLVKAEQIPRKSKLGAKGDGNSGEGFKKIKYNADELANFQASLMGLPPAAKKVKWQARIKALRADIQTNGPGGGNRKALRVAREEKAKVVRRAFMMTLDKRLTQEEKLRLFKAHMEKKQTKVEGETVDEEDIVVVGDADCADVSIKVDA